MTLAFYRNEGVAGSVSDSRNVFASDMVRQHLLDLLLGSHGCGAWVWNLSSNRVEWSPEVYKIFKLKNFDGTIESFQRLIHPDDMTSGAEEVSRAIAKRSLLQTKFRVVLPNGQIKQIGNIGRAWYNSDGTPELFIGTVFDITDRPRAAFSGSAGEPSLPQVTGYVDTQRMLHLRDELRFHLGHINETSQSIMEKGILEFLLVRLVDPDTAADQADRLLKRFQSLADVVNAPLDKLLLVEGIGERHRLLFDIVTLAMQTILRPGRTPAVFKSERSIVNYLRAAQAYQQKEQLRVIFLDRRQHIISNELMQEGTIDHTPVYTREIIKRALDLSACGLILVHNHPSGDPLPSQGDIQMTKQISRVAKDLGITVQDHIIIGREGHVSLKSMRLF